MKLLYLYSVLQATQNVNICNQTKFFSAACNKDEAFYIH